MLSVMIRVIKHEHQRYETVGDWQVLPYPAGDRYDIRVSDLHDAKMNACLAVHELIEALLCTYGDPVVTDEQVDKFDMSHPELEEPGNSPEAPYHFQHLHATEIEKYMAARFGIGWAEYERRIKEL